MESSLEDISAAIEDPLAPPENAEDEHQPSDRKSQCDISSAPSGKIADEHQPSDRKSDCDFSAQENPTHSAHSKDCSLNGVESHLLIGDESVKNENEQVQVMKLSQEEYDQFFHNYFSLMKRFCFNVFTQGGVQLWLKEITARKKYWSFGICLWGQKNSGKIGFPNWKMTVMLACQRYKCYHRLVLNICKNFVSCRCKKKETRWW